MGPVWPAGIRPASAFSKARKRPKEQARRIRGAQSSSGMTDGFRLAMSSRWDDKLPSRSNTRTCMASILSQIGTDQFGKGGRPSRREVLIQIVEHTLTVGGACFLDDVAMAG